MSTPSTAHEEGQFSFLNQDTDVPSNTNHEDIIAIVEEECVTADSTCGAGYKNNTETTQGRLTLMNTHVPSVISVAMQVVLLNCDASSEQMDHLKRTHREILVSGQDGPPEGDTEEDPARPPLAGGTDATSVSDMGSEGITVSSIPNVLMAAVAILRSDGPKHAISCATLAYTASQMVPIIFDIPETASSPTAKRSTQFVSEAIELSNVAYRDFFDSAAEAVTALANIYINSDATERAHVECMVRAHVVVDAFSLAVSERIAAELVLEFSQLATGSDDATIDPRACDLLATDMGTTKAVRLRASSAGLTEPNENQPEPASAVHQLRIGGMIAALAAVSEMAVNTHKKALEAEGMPDPQDLWLARDLKVIDLMVREHMSTRPRQQASATLSGDNGQSSFDSPAKFSKTIKTKCMSIVVRLCDELTGSGDRVDTNKGSLSLLVAMFRDVPCLNLPGPLTSGANKTLFDAALAASAALDAASAPRHSAVAVVATVL